MAEIKSKDQKTPAEVNKESSNLKDDKDRKIEEPNLQYGTGTPYLALFDESGSPIMNPLTGIPLGAYVNDFKFKSGDTKEDGCIINVDTGNPNSADIESIQQGKNIIIQWGYVYPNGSFKSSKDHKLEITQLELIFDDKGTHLAITGKDGVYNLRHSPPYKSLGDDSYTMKKFLDEGMGQDIGIIIEMFE